MLTGSQIFSEEKTEARVTLEHTFDSLPMIPSPQCLSFLLDDELLNQDRELLQAWGVVHFPQVPVGVAPPSGQFGAGIPGFDGPGIRNHSHSPLKPVPLAAAVASKVPVECPLNGLSRCVLHQPSGVLPREEAKLACGAARLGGTAS